MSTEDFVEELANLCVKHQVRPIGTTRWHKNATPSWEDSHIQATISSMLDENKTSMGKVRIHIVNGSTVVSDEPEEEAIPYYLVGENWNVRKVIEYGTPFFELWITKPIERKVEVWDLLPGNGEIMATANKFLEYFKNEPEEKSDG